MRDSDRGGSRVRRHRYGPPVRGVGDEGKFGSTWVVLRLDFSNLVFLHPSRSRPFQSLSVSTSVRGFIKFSVSHRPRLFGTHSCLAPRRPSLSFDLV